ncbi:ribonuclease P protein component [Actinomycetaceae bacterium L2_0104]
MLPADHRMRRSADFATAFRGVRGGANRVLVSIETTSAEQPADLHPVKVGFVVPKSVGNSVVRHRVYRQLRHLILERLDRFEPGSLVAVRALPPAKGSSSTELAQDLDAAISKALKKLARRERSNSRNDKGDVVGTKAGEPSSSKKTTETADTADQ